MNSANIKETLSILICPTSGNKLLFNSDLSSLTDSSKKFNYPIIDSIPILINEGNSIFRIADFEKRKSLFFKLNETSKIRMFFSSIIPEIDRNHAIKSNIDFIRKNLSLGSKILVVGGSIARGPMSRFLEDNSYMVIETDVSFGPRTQIVCDVHNLPFENNTFDCVIIQAVLEHVVNPQQAVEEVYRVLKIEGLVYSEIPFMQPVHGGAYDFQRFTHSGARLLFSKFNEVKSGLVSGHGSSLAWSIQYFLIALFGFNKSVRDLIKLFSRVILYPLRWFDFISVSKRAALDAACGCYFIGRKSMEEFDKNEIIQYYESEK